MWFQSWNIKLIIRFYYFLLSPAERLCPLIYSAPTKKYNRFNKKHIFVTASFNNAQCEHQSITVFVKGTLR